MLTIGREMFVGMSAVVRRDYLRATSYRTAVFASVAGELFSFVLFYYISRLVTVEPFDSPNEYFAFVVVGLVALQILNATMYYPLYLLTVELTAGTFERIVVSPLGPTAGLIATMAIPFVTAIGGSVISIAIAALVFGITLSWPTLLLALPASIVVGAAMAPFGVLLMAVGLLTKQAIAFAGWVTLVLSLLAGLYFPVTLLPDWIEWASEVQPVTPSVDLIRNLVLGTPLEDSALLLVVELLAFAVVLFPISIWVLRQAIEIGRQRGTIIEY